MSGISVVAHLARRHWRLLLGVGAQGHRIGVSVVGPDESDSVSKLNISTSLALAKEPPSIG